MVKNLPKDEIINLYKSGAMVDAISKRYGVSKTPIYTRLRKAGIKRSRQIEMTCDYCKKIITKTPSEMKMHNNHFCNRKCYNASKGKDIDETKRFELGYITGVAFGDGCIQKKLYRIDIYTVDTDFVGVLLSILHTLCPQNSICIYNRNSLKSKKNAFVITITSKKLCKLIAPYKINYKYKPPDWITNNEEKAGLISGLFDTDGCVYESLPMTLTSKYIESLYPIGLMLKEFNINCYIKRIYNDNRQLARLYISGYENKKTFKEKINFLRPIKSEILEKTLDERYQTEKRKQKYLPEVEKLHRQGKTVSTIRDMLRLPNTTVIQWLDEINPKRDKKNFNNYTPKQYFDALNLLNHGINRYEVSKRLNIPATTLFYWLHTDTKPTSIGGV